MMTARLAILLLAAAALVASVTGCTPLGKTCSTNRACCSGRCLSRTCKPCIPDFKACTADSTCCSKSCVRGSCAPPCKKNGERCSKDSTCCTGSCNSNNSKCGCVPRGKACGAGKTGKCCAGTRCNGKTCVACTAKGDTCAKDGDCCTGLCNPYARTKTCVACKPVGQACTPGRDKLCCSGACNPLQNMCWPKRCATREGATCKEGVDCCSSRCVGGKCAKCISPDINSQKKCTADNECCGGGRASCDPDLKKCCIGDDVGGCTKDSECCNGNCVAGTCLPKGECLPVDSKLACLENNDCCSKSCNLQTKKCACLAEGRACADDASCCGKLCNIPAGAKAGTCSKPCVAEGGTCDPAAPNCCLFYGCDATQGNTCQAVCRKESEPCGEQGCCDGLWCNFSATCANLVANGGECTTNLMCVSKFCKVTPPSGIGQCAPKA